jgi:hypothetical protein
VPPAFTGQTCSGCGHEVWKGLIRSVARAPLRGLWHQPAARPQRRAEHLGAGQETTSKWGRAGPSGTNVGGCTGRRLSGA